MGGSGGSKGSGSSTSEATIAPELKPLFTQTAGQIQGYQNLPGANLGQYLDPNAQNIPQMSPEQRALVQYQGMRAFGPQVTAPEMAGLNQYSQLIGGQVGQSPITQQAIYSASRPMLNELSMAGLGNSSAVGTAMSDAAAPYLQKEIDMRMQAVPQLFGLGNTLADRQSGLLNQYGQGLGQQQDLASQQSEANFNDFLRRQALSQSLTTGVLGALPTTGLTSSTTKTKSGGGGGK